MKPKQFKVAKMNLKKVTASLLTLATVAASPVAALAQSANPTKISQCNQIIKIANETVEEAKQVNNSTKEASMQRAADVMDSAAVRMARVSITDQTLKGYQSRFIRMYRQTSQASRNFVTAYNRQDQTATSSAQRALQAATTPERQLVADINNYCSGGTGRTNRL